MEFTKQKHVHWRKFNKPMKGVGKKKQWYTNKDYKHIKNEVVYVSKRKEFTFQQVTNGLVSENHKKQVQFVTLFHTLKHGKQMLKVDVHKDLFDFLNLENNLKMHCIDTYNQAMGQHMHGIILEPIHFVVGIAHHLSLTCEEVGTIDNQNQLLIHAYLFQNWLQIPIILFLGCVVMGSNDNNFTKIFTQALMHEGGLIKKLICNRLMALCGNWVFIFQGIKKNVI